MSRFVIKKLDRLPALEASMGANLTGATVVFSMAPKSPAGAALKVSAAAAVVVDAGTGAVRFDWGATDTDTAGNFQGEFIATYTATGVKRSYPVASYLEIQVISHLPKPA